MKIDCFSVDGFSSHPNTVFEAMGCFYHFCLCQEVRPSLTKEDIQRATKEKNLDALRRECIQEKGFTVIEMWECERWRLYKTNNALKQDIQNKFPFRFSVTDFQLLDSLQKGTLLGYVQCGFEFPNTCKTNLPFAL